MNNFLLVGLGGAIGSMARYGAGRLVALSPAALVSGWPFATLFVNIAGGLLMGLLAALLLRAEAPESWRLFLGVGVLGGFTTFSAFSLELVNMIHRGQQGLALAYALLSVVLAVAALMAGLAIGRFFA